ncbi:MAG: zinc ABC transporter substrate-binding protein [Rhodobacteraceae bacterium]|nr:zinc ABC transporter substrate-binding protein [Paracoccaceae bacterium]
MRRLLLVLAVTLSAATAAPAQPVLLATIGMIADPAQRMAGDCVTVEVLIGPGLDPHLYQARPSDIARLRDADRIVALGLGLEGRLGAILERVGAATLGPAIDPAVLLTHGGAPDPHVWMDPAIWATTFPALADVLTALAPDCADRIAAGRDAEIARAQDLDRWAEETLATIPPSQRVLLTAHDAFHYFSRRYGLENAAIQGISTESEPSIADIDATAQLAADRAVPAAFVETTLNPRAVRALVEAAAAHGHDLAIGGSLYSDALGEAGSAAGSWPGMIVANVTTIATALGGTVSPAPPHLLP